MKRMLVLSAIAAFTFAAPAQAGGLLGGTNGIAGVNVGVSTGHVSVANGVLNGNNVLSGIGVGNGSNILSGNGVNILDGNAILNGNGLDLDLFNTRSHRRGKRW